MCGIAGFLAPGERQEREHRIRAMARSIEHRGPDDDGFFLDGEVALGFRRLSIIDLEGGHQPLSNEDGTVWIVFNGEIYNFKELRARLEAKGHRFRSRSDTETIVHAYEQWGTGCLEHLRGMFAFAIWDQREHRLFLAVDRSGIKPLYYTSSNDVFAFASEAKALFASGYVNPEIDHSTLPCQLAFLTAPFPRTLFKNVHKLSPGHFLLARAGQVTIRQYWDLEITEDAAAWRANPYPRVRESLRSATLRQSIADVPLGAFLSGGIDSSAVAAFLQEDSASPLHTYFVAFSPEDLRSDVLLDERPYAEKMAEELGSRHRSLVASADIETLLPKLVWHLDEPIGDPAAVSTYLVSKEARSSLTVLLSGVGGDEVFAGYPRYLAMSLQRLYRRLPVALRSLAKLGSDRLPGGRRALFRKAQKFTRATGASDCDTYFKMLSYFDPAQQQRLLTPDLRAAVQDIDVYEEHRRHWQAARDLSPLNRLLYVDFKIFLPSLNLMYTDKMSMAASIEVRVPFLDDDLVKEMFTLPAREKLRGRTRKYALKKAMDGVVPDDIVWRPKAGFGCPIHSWIAGPLKGMVEDYLAEDRLRRQGIFDPGDVRRLLDEEYSNQAYNSNHIWQLLTFQLWHEQWMERAAPRLGAED